MSRKTEIKCANEIQLGNLGFEIIKIFVAYSENCASVCSEIKRVIHI